MHHTSMCDLYLPHGTDILIALNVTAKFAFSVNMLIKLLDNVVAAATQFKTQYCARMVKTN